MKNEKSLFRKTNAITLIALVVTIVVLLILAGISISMLMRENGIITRANEATIETAHAQVKEQIRLKINEYVASNEAIDFIEYLQSEKGKKILNLDGSINLANISSNNIKIGKGTGTRDVYKIEKDGAKNYSLKYYDNKGIEVILDTINLSGGRTPEEIYYGDASIVPTDAKYFTFSLDEETKTAALTGVKEEYGVFGYYGGDITDQSYIISIKDGEKIITDVVIPYEIIENDTKYTITDIMDRAFWVDCFASNLKSEFTSFVIPNTVASIGSDAFYGCESLTSIIIPNSVTSIGSSTFSWCKGLTSITIPDSVTSIGSYAFGNCRGLTSITIPNSVTRIDDETFYGCKSLTNIIIPESVTSIGCRAFYRCESLTSITIPNSVTSIDDETFYGCKSLTNIIIPESVTSIGGWAFYECKSLTSITIPNSVTSIEKYAFYGCERLTNITIPNTVTSIGGYAFGGCTGLTSITIPDSVTSIGGYAFCDCTGLTSITIPNRVILIGNKAFDGCTNLTSINIQRTEDSISGSPWGAPNATVTWSE